MKFALFFLGEYAAMFVMGAVTVTIFLGGWTFFGLESLGWIVQLLIFSGKVLVLLFVFLWVRWTIPRFRYDQLMRLGWQALETSLALVFAGITVLDAVRVRSAAQQQRRLLHDLVLLAPGARPWRRHVAGYLDILAHTPSHVAAGLVWGFLFALAFGTV